MGIVKPGTPDALLFQGLLAHEHYLGARNSVGENIRYLVRERHGLPVACVLFGSAAWKLRSPRLLPWLGPLHARTQPPTPHQQHPLPDSALGPGSASRQSCAGPHRAPHPCRLAGKIGSISKSVEGRMGLMGAVRPQTPHRSPRQAFGGNFGDVERRGRVL